ncbi:hypothetical protein BWI17_14600 [Betaproteobacteria bacterium GR16-43]|nr:hypothetical protein BWI17_14600 [Betaproteobacteria bacterium GR16-43]
MAHTIRISKSASILLAAALAATLPAAAQWEARGAPEPIVRGMTSFFNTPVAGTDTLYAGTLGAGFFKVEVSGTGASWVQANTGLPSLRLQNIAASSASTIYAAPEGHGVYRTTDGGATWSPRSGSGATAIGCPYIRGLTIFGSAIYAGTSCTSGGGVFRSTDGGATWTRLGGLTLPGDIRVQSIVVSGFAIMVNTNNGGIYRSNDDGATFVPSNTGFVSANPTVYHLIFSTTTGVALAYVEGEGIYKSTDSGATWAPSNTGLPAGAVVLSGFSRGTGTNTFYVGLDKHGVYRTTDDGATWTLWADPAADSTLGVVRGVITGSPNGRIYANTLAGISIVDLSGNAVAKPSGLYLGHGRANSIVHDVADRRTVLLATNTVRRISNLELEGYGAAAAWDGGITGHTTEGTLLQVRSNAPTLYVTTNNRGIFKTVNSGMLWSAVNTGLPSLGAQSPKLAIDPTNASKLLAGMSNLQGSGVYRSTDGGANWHAANVGLATRASRVVNSLAFTQNGYAYAATDAGVYRSTDGGETWTAIYTALDSAGQLLPTAGVFTKPDFGNQVWLANSHLNPDGTLPASSGAWKSIDNGDTWTQVFAGQNVERIDVASTAHNTGPVLIGVGAPAGQPAVYRSVDGGVSWTAYSAGLGGSDIRTFGSAPNGGRTLSLSLEDGLYVAKRAQSLDFSADAKTDILWSHTDGRAAIWMLDGLTTTDGGEIINAGTGWSVTHIADLNGDRKSDLMWRHTDGRTALYLMDGRVPTATQQIFNAGDGWVVTNTPDLNGDGKADLLFRHPDGRIAAWLMDGTTMIAGDTLRAAGTGWYVAQVGDINGDGTDDLVMAHTDGRYEIWLMNGLTKVLSYPIMNAGAGWTLTHVADFDADGTKDLLWRSAQGSAAIWLSPNANGPQLLGDNTGWKVKHVGDFNGDGYSDVYFEHTDGRAAIWLIRGMNILATAQILNAGTGWSAKALGDVNGDGKADILWQHSDGRVAIWMMDGLTLSSGAEILGPGSGWSIADTGGPNPAAGECPTGLPSNVVMLPDMPAINVPLTVLLPQGVIGATKVPQLPANRISGIFISGESTQAYSPNPAVITMSFSKCPGDLSYHTQQVDPTFGDVCYLRSTNINYNNVYWKKSSGAGTPAGMCYLPEGNGPWYLNVRYEHNGCAYGATTCGTALQWGQGPY